MEDKLSKEEIEKLKAKRLKVVKSDKIVKK